MDLRYNAIGAGDLIEEVLLVRDDPEYIKRNLEGFCGHCDDEEKYARLIYVGDPQKTFIYGDLLTANEIFKLEMIVGKKTDFSDFLKENPPRSFKDCLFLLTVYWRRKELRVDDPFRPAFKPGPLLDDIFSDSRGYLVWYYQFEAFLKHLFGQRLGDLASSVRCMDELRDLRCLEDLKVFCRANGKDVSGILDERMLFERIRLPMVKPALRLHTVLFGNHEPKDNS